MSTPPTLIAIDHDDHYAHYVGTARDGRQFFLTTPFVPAIDGKAGCEFIAMYIFDAAGKLLEAKIENLGPRATLDHNRRLSFRDQWLAELGSVRLERIQVQPFSLERFATTFGLIPRPPEEEDDSWAVEVQPGNYMAFFEPWDSGDYDT